MPLQWGDETVVLCDEAGLTRERAIKALLDDPGADLGAIGCGPYLRQLAKVAIFGAYGPGELGEEEDE